MVIWTRTWQHGRRYGNIDEDMTTWTRTWQHGHGHGNMDMDMETWTRTWRHGRGHGEMELKNWEILKFYGNQMGNENGSPGDFP